MKELDNIKMWEKILCYMDDYTGSHINPAGVIKQALKDQGFKFDGEHIVPINQEPLKIEKGKWYMCINQFHNWIEGDIYTSIHDGRIIDYFGNEYDMLSDASEYFRPATEEEIASQSYNPFDDFRKSDTEKSEQKQETSYIELTEFEKVYLKEYHHLEPQDLEDWKLKEVCNQASKLLSVARKQFIEEGCEWIKNVSSFAWPRREFIESFRNALIESFRNALEKGE